jgi:hypothetical protein
MKKSVTSISESELDNLRKNHDVISVSSDMNLVYEKQVPIAGLVLIQGELEFTKKYKTHSTVNSSCIVGLNEVMNELTVQLGCKVKKNSEVILLSKSELMNATEEHSDIFPLIRKYLRT